VVIKNYLFSSGTLCHGFWPQLPIDGRHSYPPRPATRPTLLDASFSSTRIPWVLLLSMAPALKQLIGRFKKPDTKYRLYLSTRKVFSHVCKQVT
jgi:hypothetical protein